MKRWILLFNLMCVCTLSGFKLGLETVSQELLTTLCAKPAAQVSIGLVSNQTGKDQAGQRNVDLLLKKGIHVKRIFAPEHGFEGTVHAEKDVHDGIDVHTKIPIVSLYRYYPVKNIDANMLEGIDILLFDIQDAGVRHFTYVSILLHVMKAAAQHNVPLLVLDRPNVLGGVMEGPLVEPTLTSFISVAPIPLRYGLTIGELAVYFNKYVLPKPARVHVAAMEGYTRGVHDLLHNTKLSPNVPCLKSCYGYSFLGALGEVRPFDLSVGTDKAFQTILLAKKDDISEQQWAEFRTLLLRHGIKSKYYTYVSTRKKQQCMGVELTIETMPQIATFSTLLAIMDFFKKIGVPLQFSPSFDKALGTSLVRQYIEGSVSREQLAHHVNGGIRSFHAQAQAVLLYKPAPRMVFI